MGFLCRIWPFGRSKRTRNGDRRTGTGVIVPQPGELAQKIQHLTEVVDRHNSSAMKQFEEAKKNTAELMRRIQVMEAKLHQGTNVSRDIVDTAARNLMKDLRATLAAKVGELMNTWAWGVALLGLLNLIIGLLIPGFLAIRR